MVCAVPGGDRTHGPHPLLALLYSPFGIRVPDGHSFLIAADTDAVHEWQVDATQDDLLAWVVANRYVPELTCEQRQRYHVEPLCDEAGAEPRSVELSSVGSSPPSGALKRPADT